MLQAPDAPAALAAAQLRAAQLRAQR